MVRVLLIDDDARLAELLRGYLEPQGVTLVHAAGGQAGLGLLAGDGFDVVLLDVMMPGLDGLAVLRRLRADGHRLPVIMLTARGDESDRVVGLELGADDYVAKPFSPRELLARVKAILRRGGAAGAPGSGGADVVSGAGVTVNRVSREVTVGDAAVDLTGREFDLLATLLEHPNAVLDRDRLLELVWGFDFPGGTRTVDVHVAQLRRKLGRPGLIATVRGIGYKAVV